MAAAGVVLAAATVAAAPMAQAAASIATPTTAELSTLSNDVSTYFNAGTIDNGRVYSTLSADLSAASAALGRGNTKAATNDVQTFINDTAAQSGKHIASWAASVLI